MTTYLDVSSLAPTSELAAKRCELLSLSGSLVPELWRYEVLAHAGDGDEIICGPLAVRFWRKLSPQARLRVVTRLGEVDPAAERISSWLEWTLVQDGLTVTEAKKLVASPPKTTRHRYYYRLERAQHKAFVLAGSLGKIQLPEFDLVEAEVAVASKPYKWTLVEDTDDNIEDVEQLLQYYITAGLLCGVDVETDVEGDRPNEMQDVLVGVGIAFGKDCYYGSIGSGKWRALLQLYLPKLRWVGHNAKYDASVLCRHGILVAAASGDSLLGAYLLGVPEAGLKKLVADRYGYQMITYDEVVGVGRNRQKISEIDPLVVAEYCCSDAYFGWLLEADIRNELDAPKLELYKLDLELSEIIGRMQERGIKFNRESATERLEQLVTANAAYIEAIDVLATASGFTLPELKVTCKSCRGGVKKKVNCTTCYGIGKWTIHQPINPGSGQQLAGWLFGTLKMPVQKLTVSGDPSTDALSLLRIKHLHVAPSMILTYKRNDKYIGYLRSWLKWSEKDGRLHTVFTMTRTRSSRLSSTDPNLQQVKRAWREDFG